MVQPGAGGLSVSPESPYHLPAHRRPPAFGGTGLDPVWALRIAALPVTLTYRPDPAIPLHHGFIEPATPMALAMYQRELAATRELWQMVPPRDVRERAEVEYMQTQHHLEVQLSDAFQVSEPLLALRDLMRELLLQGWQREQLLAELEQFRVVLRERGQRDDEDCVLEVMDFLAGWASPHMKV